MIKQSAPVVPAESCAPRPKMSRRQFLALTGSVAVGAALAACAAPVATPGDGAAAPAGDETTQLVAWFTDRRSINEMSEEVAIPAFEAEHAGLSVELQFVPENELQQKLLTAKAAGNAPDVSAIDETFLDTLQKQDVLRPIPEEVLDVDEEMGELTADLYNIPSGADGPPTYYGLPNGVFGSELYYNAALLDELGYTPEDIPDNWDDFLAWASEITRWDGDTLELSGMAVYGNEFSIYEDLRYQMAGPIDGNFYPTKTTVQHNDDVGNAAWDFIMGLYSDHRLDSIEAGLNARERFGFGQAVTLYNWTWFNGVMDTQYTDIEWGLVLPPKMPDAQVHGRRGPDVGFTVTTQNEEHLEAAHTFYRYLVSPAYLSEYCKLRGIQPSLREMWDDPGFSADAGPKWGAIAVKNRPENSVDPGFWPRELSDINTNMLPSIRDEGEEIATVLQRADEAGTEFLQNSPQWSIISGEDYADNPEWLTERG